jgi:hypothetical protein
MRTIAALLAGLALVTGATAATRLDDSASPRHVVNVETRWLHAEEGLTPDQLNALVATVTNLEFRLDTSRYVGKRGRIWLVLPDVVPGLRSPEALRVEWTTRGTFLSGSAFAGQRTLVYEGPIRQASLHEALDLRIYLDARHLEANLRLDPMFEIDLAP